MSWCSYIPVRSSNLYALVEVLPLEGGATTSCVATASCAASTSRTAYHLFGSKRVSGNTLGSFFHSLIVKGPIQHPANNLQHPPLTQPRLAHCIPTQNNGEIFQGSGTDLRIIDVLVHIIGNLVRTGSIWVKMRSTRKTHSLLREYHPPFLGRPQDSTFYAFDHK